MVFLLFFGALAILILSHEFGHFIVAKRSGIKVEEFGFGFPPRLFGIKKGETLYSVNLLPFGGFVKIFGENETEKTPRSFSSKPIYIRALILSAGVFFNLLLAWFLFSTAFFIGAPAGVDEAGEGAVTILEVQEATPAQTIGLQPGDQIQRLSYGAEILEVQTVAQVQDFISRHKGKTIRIDYLRGKDFLSAKVIPDISPGEEKGALGIAMDKIGIIALPFHLAVWEGLKNTVFFIGAIVGAFAGIIASIVKGTGVAIQVMGPVGIVGIVGTAAEFGLVYVIQLIALLSINLAIINFIPFPALDGGRLLFLGIEAVKRSPVSQKVMAVSNTIGFAILIFLMLLVTYKDIARLF